MMPRYEYNPSQQECMTIFAASCVESVARESGFAELNKNFATAPGYNWIGRPPFAGDQYLAKTKVADFRVYNVCVGDKELKKLTK